jgi:hypothetical protein
MRSVDLGRTTPVVGRWQSAEQLNISDVRRRDIYHSPLEPSYVCWAILWKERDGTLKVSFVEATGELTAWPPTYNFNSGDIEYYLKTLVSKDGGATWQDTGWREDLDGLWEVNPDHHIRHVFQAQDGSLLRNYCHSLPGQLTQYNRLAYDESKVMSVFPFSTGDKFEGHRKFSTTWRSLDGGRTWEEIHVSRPDSLFFVTGFHQLRNGSIVATGAIRNSETNCDTWQVGLTESHDGGRNWSPVQILAENDDALVRQGMGEESDFVELDDGRLLLLERTDGAGINMMQMYLTRNASGRWHASTPQTHPLFVHSGYPYLHRASDGTVFYYCHTSIKYSCDDGRTWHAIPLGYSYYGQLVETAPGHMVAITQKNIGDCCYPWKHDTAMHQASFAFERTLVQEQTDPASLGALAVLDVGESADVHVCAEVRADGETGLAFGIDGDAYGFVAVVIPCNEVRAPGRAAGKEQDAMLVVGKHDRGTTSALRKLYLGKVIPGTWVELQLDVSAGVLKAAAKTSEADWMTGGSPATYAVVRDDVANPGKLGLFTQRSTGAFRNVRVGPGGTEIRSNWRSAQAP